MRSMLTSHPNIAMTRRTNLWPRFYNRYGDLSRRENFERCLDAMLHYKHVAFLKPDADRIRREFWQGTPSYARLFALFQEHHAEQEGKPRWGDQTERIERYADLVLAAYPTAKMIHMIRDPRDRYEASHTRRRRWVGGATARWLHSVGLAKRNLQNYPDRYKVVRYETMVTYPEATLREVCAFLDEEYHPAMLVMAGAPRFQREIGSASGNGSGQSPLSTEFIGRYRQALSQREIAFMQMHAGREMAAFGYALEPIQFSPGERLRFWLVDWPVNLLLMLAWRAVESIQRRSPAQAGRKSGAKKAIRRQGSGQNRAGIA
jgi:hypothetical protein